MRLSCTPVCILRFALIAFLTLFLKPDARAQSVFAANSPHHASYNKSPIEIAGCEPIESVVNTEKYGAEVDDRSPSKVNFSALPISPAPNSCRIFTGCRPLRGQIGSACIQHSVRITLKFFKLVIVPLWYLK